MNLSWNTLGTFFKYPWNFLKKFLKLPWNSLKTPFELWTPLKLFWNTLKFLQTPIELLLNTFESQFKLHWNTLQSSLNHPWDFIETPLKLTWGTLKSGLQKRYDCPITQNGDENLPQQIFQHFNEKIIYDVEKQPFLNAFLCNLGVFTPNLYSLNLFWALNTTQMGQVCYFFLNLPIEVKPSLVPLVPRYLSFCNSVIRLS